MAMGCSLVTPPARPTLSVRAAAGRVLEISWPADSGDWTLETTSSLGVGDAVWEGRQRPESVDQRGSQSGFGVRAPWR